jgi:hypothetical protein
MIELLDILLSDGRVRCWHIWDMPPKPENVQLSGAGSTGRRNTSVKSLYWGCKLQGLTWSFV